MGKSIFNVPAAFVGTTFIFIYMSGCTFDKSFPDPDNYDNLVCFETEVLPLIQSNCAKAGCHDALTKEDGYDFTSYDGIMKAVKPGKPNSSKLFEVLNGNGEDMMPPPPNLPLNDDQKNTIKVWIEQGASNGPCSIVFCDTTNVTYSGTVAPIIQNNCLGCHANTSTGGGILLNSYAGVYAQAKTGALLSSISWDGYTIPMPQNGSQLDNCSIKSIEIWINDGALEN